MKSYLLIFTAGLLLLVSPLMTKAPAAAEAEVKSRLSLCLTTDKTIYAPGETIRMTLVVANHTPDEVILRFRNAQRFDFLIDQERKPIWRWSKGRMFAQVLGEERLRPGESMTFFAKFDEKLQPGKYHITGMIVADPSPLTASSNIVIR